MNVRLRTVYSELWIDPETRHEEDPNSVFVEIRRYERKGELADVIMQSVVIVDAEAVVFAKMLLSSHDSDATLQRTGIARFDELLAAHPAHKPNEGAI